MDVAMVGLGRMGGNTALRPQAIAHSVPMPAISAALFTRFRSRQQDTFSGKVLAALRNEFGGHAVKEKE
jgi:6-phosphogluconate dehydrogenase